uniref:Uncharacterized protein n=1 Tax=Pithovirus LCPAC102 TaxID=2506587 RepID=A0A481Z350_9VIRU|nr:MAG: hypothetical protein LCPAC102_02060 [Pithovirus LCPAC102]
MREIIILIFVIYVSRGHIYEKSLAGPPSEFKQHRIPDPKDFARIENSVLETLLFNITNLIINYTIPVDTPRNFTFSLSSPCINDFDVSLYDPTGQIVNTRFRQTNFTWGVGNTVQVETSTIFNNMIGNYTLNFRVINTTDIPFELIIIWLNNDDLTVSTYLSSYVIADGKSIDMIADVDLIDTSMSFHDVDVTEAFIEVIDSEGKSYTLPMEKETMSETDEGIWSGTIPLLEQGVFIFSPTICGTFVPVDNLARSISNSSRLSQVDDIHFMRASRHLIIVSNADISIGNKAKIIEKDCDIFFLIIRVKNRGTIDRFRYYTEIWGVDIDGDEFPIVWLGGLTNITNNIVKIQLNKKWLSGISYCDDIILKNTYLADVNTSFPVDNHPEDIQVNKDYDVLEYIKVNSYIKVNITREMREGINPLKRDKKKKRDIEQRIVGLIMLPGYCSNNNPWLSSSDIFTNAFYFNEFNLNLSNDAYARRVVNFIFTTPARVTTYISHSQGGMVSTHILNYYFTDEEDQADGGRLIQSVGTPYQGTALADDVASFARVFGVGCGANSDLSKDGAANWISGISTFLRAEIFYYTTTYPLGSIIDRFCNIGTGLLISDPNDGITELLSGQMPNANNAGNTENQCHTTGMRHPAQYNDRARNIEMNRLAARGIP